MFGILVQLEVFLYAMVCTRLEISHVVGVLSRYMSKPRKDHWTTVKRVFRYLCVMNTNRYK
jgi:hypothetical protein